MIKLDKTVAKGKWYTYGDDGDVEFYIVPFPFTRSILDFIDEDEKDMQVMQMKRMFEVCVTDWKGLVDEKDEPLKCNKANKAIVFDNAVEIVNFVLEKINSDENKVLREVKN